MSANSVSAGNISSIEERIRALPREKAQLLRLLLAAESGKTQGIPRYPRESLNGVTTAVASWAQQRLSFICQLEGASAAYHTAVGVRLKGQLDPDALQCALEQVVDRHESLRTVFANAGGELRQVIMPNGDFTLQRVDLSDLAGEERESRAREQQMEEAQKGFNLQRGPLIRGRLVRLQSEEHLLFITMHHIVTDGWSIGVLFSDLASFYRQDGGPGHPSPTPLPIQYADYAQWQQESLGGELLERQTRYWRTRLAGAAPQLELPTDHPRPPVSSFRGRSLELRLDRALSQSVRVFAKEHDLTLFMVLYAGWALLLYRLSGQEDIVIGTPVANRQRPELEGLIGLFVNTLVLRVGVHSQMPLTELLHEVKSATLGAFDHQDLPFERVVEDLKPPRSLNRNPIFQVMFALQSSAGRALNVPGLIATVEDPVEEPAMLDLLLSLEDRDDGIVGTLSYATDLFEGPTLERWIGSYREILRELTSQPGLAVGELQILPLPERTRVLEGFNSPQTSYASEGLIHELFEEQVRSRPMATAVTYEGKFLSYRDLNSRANELAWILCRKGVAPEQLVGVYLERGLEMVVGLLGILKAGGAYVPLDPAYPQERLAYVLSDSAPRVLLTQSSLLPRLPRTSAEVVLLDSGTFSQDTVGNPDLRSLGLSSRNLAYVIYTSGSTGLPKGVMIEHRNVTRLFAATRGSLQFNENDVWSLFHSYAFDFSVWELWGALLHGGHLLIVPQLTTRSPLNFYELICDTGVTVLNQTPSAFNQLIEAQSQSPVRSDSLRLVIFGGEALELHKLRPWVKRNGLHRPQLVNMYGITETTVHVTNCPLTAEDIESERGSLVGKPISDLRVYLLDPQEQPVPVGVGGEIYVGGAGVARGYLNRPDLTASRFVHDRFGAGPHDRLYRSGDLARWHDNGTLEYLGRNDHQVKIRGFRIELGEIEAQLACHPGVREAVVIVREDVPGERRLVAYWLPVRPSPGELPGSEKLRAYLAGLLPEHMVPSAFVMLEQYPLTSNGKLDRRALPEPELQSFASRPYEPPRGEVESAVAVIWQELLGLERVGRLDHFFELGGHSMLIIRLLERLRRAGFSADVRRVFESPILADLAQALAGHLADSPSENENPFLRTFGSVPVGCQQITPSMLPLVDLQAQHIDYIVQVVPGGARNIQDIYPLGPLQEGMLFHHILTEGGGDVYCAPTLLAVQSEEQLNALIAALQKVIDRHDVLRTAVLWERLPQPVQVVCREARLPVDSIKLSPDRELDQQIQDWLSPDRQRVDLRQAPLMRLQVAADPRGSRWYVALQVHHIVGDNASQEALTAEVVALLTSRSHLLKPAVSYRTHVAQTLAYARNGGAEAYFRSKLGDIDEPTAPFGLLDTQADGNQIDESQKQVDALLAQQLRFQARQLGVTAATLFHAAWALVLSRASNRDDVVFGTVLLGRLQGEADTQRALGMLINTLPLRIRLKDVTIVELVEQARDELVGLLSHELASLSVAQRCSCIPGSVPLFTSLVNYRHAITDPDADWSRAGIEVIRNGQDRTNYPIALAVDDQGDGFSLTVQTDRRVEPGRVVAYLETALRSMIVALQEKRSCPALDLLILPESERLEQLQKFNATARGFSQNRLLHEIFEDQATTTPNASAVVCAGKSLTFAELNRQANQLARYLIRHHAVQGALVGVCMDRDAEMVVGLLAILKAGAAYVPLDPASPTDRLNYIVRDASSSIVLTLSGLKQKLTDTASILLALDERWDEITQEMSDNLEWLPTGRCVLEAAYVIYTSGSTGQPKGVLIEHRNVVNLWYGLEHLVDVGGRCQRIALNASMSFDASVQQFVQLLSGRTLFLVPEEVRKDSWLLLRFLGENGIEGIDCTPSQLRTWIDAGLLTRAPSSLRFVLVGGEPIDAQLWAQLSQHSRIAFYNVYGPTECTVDATAIRISREVSNPSIGRPMINRSVYILGRDNRLLPIGAIGEIAIGGEGVGRGYINRQDLTAARFSADPYAVDTAARMYWTGDLGRWRPDGTLECLGRNDDQVKVRGFRIELGEIAAQLLRHTLVSDAAVIVLEDTPGDKRLAAYVVLRSHDSSFADIIRKELRSHLRASLPDHMIPSSIMFLERLPLTSSGKVDRRQLPVVQADNRNEEYVPLINATEETLARIWKDVLCVERVGRTDNFFELGGHSLLATRVISRLREALQVEIPLKAIFEAPSLRDLASVLEQHETANRSRRAPLVTRVREDRPPLSFAQERLWFLDRFEVVGTAYNMQLPLRLRGSIDEIALERSLVEITRRHESLRTRFAEGDGSPYQVIDSPGRFELRRVDLTNPAMSPQREHLLLEWVEKEAQYRFSLSEGPLFRGILIRLGEQDQALVLTMHHIISDGWSMGIVRRELSTLYGAYSRGRVSPLPAPPVQYVDYAIWQREWLRGDILQEQLRYWRNRLEDAPPQLTLPYDRPRPKEASFKGALFGFELPAELLASLRQLARASGATLFMVALAAFQALLSRYTGAQDVVVGSPIAGRTHAHTEALIGFFVNMLVLRTDLSGNPTFRELLARVRSLTLEAYAHQDLPFEKLVKELRPERDLARQPMFQVALALQNAPREELELQDVQWSPLVAAYHTAVFDLTLHLYEPGESETESSRGLAAQIEYSTDLFNPKTIERMAEHFQVLLERAVAAPDSPMG